MDYLKIFVSWVLQCGQQLETVTWVLPQTGFVARVAFTNYQKEEKVPKITQLYSV